jgi:nucleotidyltransferase/DNA polymerase involved in DNA repair
MTTQIACLHRPGGFGSLERAAAFAEACLRFSPQLALRGEEAVFVEIGGCRHLYDETGFRRRAEALARRFFGSDDSGGGTSGGGMGTLGGATPPLRITVAPTAVAAWVAARHGGPAGSYGVTLDLARLPLAALADFADPFATEPPARSDAFRRQLARWIERLEDLGVRHLADFTRLPPRTLTARFGVEAAWLSRRISTGEDAVWPCFRPPERIREHEELLHPETLDSTVVSLEGALFGLKRVLDRALARLKARGLRLAGMELVFRLERGRDRRWSIALPFPQGATTALLPILRDRLGPELDRQPLAAAIQRLEIEVTETAPGHGAQRELFRGGGPDAEENEALDSLLGRLSSKLGPGAAFRAKPVDRHLPEGAWLPCLDAAARPPEAPPTDGRVAKRSDPPPTPRERGQGAPSEHESQARSSVTDVPRPTRLLKRPAPLERRGSELSCVRGRRRWRVLAWLGPERLSGEWWRESTALRGGFARDYWRARTAEGQTLWVYATPEGRIYLHGFFD